MERDKKTPQNVERDKVPGNEPEEKRKDLPMCDKETADDRAKKIDGSRMDCKGEDSTCFYGRCSCPETAPRRGSGRRP